MSSARDDVAAGQAIRLRGRGPLMTGDTGKPRLLPVFLLPIDPLAALRALSEQELIVCSVGVRLETLRALGV
jgi:hypothetical protein